MSISSESVEDVEESTSNRNLKKIQKYVDQMAYLPGKTYTATQRVEELAKPKKLYLLANYEEKRDYLKSEGREGRFHQNIAKLKAITPDQLENIIRTERKKATIADKTGKKQEKLYQETLKKLDEQCESQYLNVLMKKFAKYIAKQTVKFKTPAIQTDSHRRLQQSLLGNILITVSSPTPKTCQNSIPNYNLYNKLAYTLADLLLKVMYIAQKRNNFLSNDEIDSKGKESSKQEFVDTEMDKCLKLRALKAARKILNRRGIMKEAC